MKQLVVKTRLEKIVLSFPAKQVFWWLDCLLRKTGIPTESATRRFVYLNKMRLLLYVEQIPT